MLIAIKNVLARVKLLMSESKFRETVKVLNGFEDMKSFEVHKLQDQYELHYLRNSLFLELGYMKKAHRFVELAYKESKQIKNEFQTIDVLLTKYMILTN